MISLPGLNGPQHARLRAIELGRGSHFEGFKVDAQGRTLHVWVFDDDGLEMLRADGVAAPAEAAEAADPEPAGPRPVVPVPVATGARAAVPGARPLT